MAGYLSATKDPLRFGVFELDPSVGELRKHGVRVKLQDQPFAVLLILLERPGQLVTKEELQQRLWSADTFVEFDKGIYNAMKRLRETLGDEAETPRYIETIPKRGYRFLAEVHKIGSNASSVPLEPPSPKLGPSNINQEQRTIGSPVGTGNVPAKRVWLSVGATLLALLCGIGIWRYSRNRSEAPLPPIEIVPLVGLAGFEADAAFSPDGNHVAFGLYESKDSGIYTTAVGSEKSLRLTSDVHDCCPRWSPDGRQIAFSRFFGDGYDFYVIPASGGTEHRLSSWPAEGHQIPTVPRFRTIVRCFDWSPDGKVLAFTNSQADETHSWIALLSLVDSTVRPLTSPPSPNIDYAPAFSPDGSTVAFIRGIPAGVVEDLYLVPAAGGTPKRLTFDNAWINSPPAWTPDGRDVVFTSMRGGSWALWRIPASGGTPQPVSGVGVDAVLPSISLKGNQLVYQQISSGDQNIWRLNLRDEKHPQGQPATAISGKGGSGRPHFSPDGKKIAFESSRLGYSEIWACDSDGTHCGQLTSLHGVAGAARWSPDGQYIAFEYRPREHSEIYLLEMRTGVPRMLTTLPGADNGGPNWSRDGKWIYFYSDRGGGPFQLWKTQISGGPPVQVTRNGGIFAAESNDGRFLYYSKFESPGIWKMPLNGGEEIHVSDQPPGDDWFNWALTPSGIYFFDESKSGTKPGVKFLDFATGKKVSIADEDRECFGFAVSPDSKSIIYGLREPDQSSIMLVKNFR
jgi:Tol biopolymer transport system component/DNA-binding winged helix-turn-helix (wHTH) protein